MNQMNQVHVRVHPHVRGPKVERFVYSQFAEHLGRCIYPGIWVGDRKDIPNDGGIRLDVVEALKALEIPALRWPGGCFADNYHWMDGIGPTGATAQTPQPLVEAVGIQCVWHPRILALLRNDRDRAVHLRQRGQWHRRRSPVVGGVLQLRGGDPPHAATGTKWSAHTVEGSLLGRRQ